MIIPPVSQRDVDRGPPPIDLAIDERVLVRLDDVFFRVGDEAPGVGQVVVTTARLALTSEPPWRWVLQNVVDAMAGVVHSLGPRRWYVPIASISSVEHDRSTRLFHRLRVGLRDGRVIVLDLGLRAPGPIVAALTAHSLGSARAARASRPTGLLRRGGASTNGRLQKSWPIDDASRRPVLWPPVARRVRSWAGGPSLRLCCRLLCWLR